MNIKYKNKIVAFIDVLGFSEIVYSKTTQREKAVQQY
jgi:predicted fused transcriptional regulator/phosphomethylpyrimidine kinase